MCRSLTPLASCLFRLDFSLCALLFYETARKQCDDSLICIEGSSMMFENVSKKNGN